jgi:hypothetical protein
VRAASVALVLALAFGCTTTESPVEVVENTVVDTVWLTGPAEMWYGVCSVCTHDTMLTGVVSTFEACFALAATLDTTPCGYASFLQRR